MNQTQFKALNPVIPVRDIHDALAFYDNKLGFVRLFEDAAEPGAALVFYEDL